MLGRNNKYIILNKTNIYLILAYDVPILYYLKKFMLLGLQFRLLHTINLLCFISKCILNRMDVAILSNTSRLIFKTSSVDIINEIDCGMS